MPATVKYPVPEPVRRRIDNDFSYHPPHENQVPRYELIRSRARELALLIAETVPFSREQGNALDHLEEVCFWANAGIARNE